MLSEDIKIYLPKFLSSESTQELFQCLKDFPNNIDERIYTSYLKEEDYIFQGDGINNMLVINLPNPAIRPTPSMVLSNTCDISQDNARLFNTNILYSPIFNLRKYKEKISTDSTKSPQAIEDHIAAIKRQEVTQIFYLPELKDQIEDSIVFFDRVCNCSNSIIKKEKISSEKIFTLSDYGSYLFLLKLSINFTRIFDKVERKHGGSQDI